MTLTDARGMGGGFSSRSARCAGSAGQLNAQGTVATWRFALPIPAVAVGGRRCSAWGRRDAYRGQKFHCAPQMAVPCTRPWCPELQPRCLAVFGTRPGSGARAACICMPRWCTFHVHARMMPAKDASCMIARRIDPSARRRGGSPRLVAPRPHLNLLRLVQPQTRQPPGPARTPSCCRCLPQPMEALELSLRELVPTLLGLSGAEMGEPLCARSRTSSSCAPSRRSSSCAAGWSCSRARPLLSNSCTWGRARKSVEMLLQMTQQCFEHAEQEERHRCASAAAWR